MTAAEMQSYFEINCHCPCALIQVRLPSYSGQPWKYTDWTVAPTTIERYYGCAAVQAGPCVLQEQQQQLGLLHAFQLLLTLRQLDFRLSCGQQEQLQLLTIGASILVGAGTLGLAHGSYLKSCLTTLTPFSAGEHKFFTCICVTASCSCGTGRLQARLTTWVLHWLVHLLVGMCHY